MTNTARPEFGTDGVRGTYGKDLTPKFAFTLGCAIARVLGTEKVFFIGRDTRTSGPVLYNALASGITACGGQVNDLSIMTTPGIAYCSREFSMPALAITASHNPASDNGVKMFAAGGTKISAEQEAAIEDYLDNPEWDLEVMEHDDLAPNMGTETAIYVQYLYSLVHGKNLNGLKVVLDCANGAAFGVAPVVFEMAGADVTKIHVESDGVHINENCGATHVDSLVNEVKLTGADIGFAFDGDADRLIAVDSNGHVRDGDVLLALFATDMKDKGFLAQDSVVATSMSNGGLRNYLATQNIDFVETPVGDKYVLAELLENGYSLGGEQSGHIIRLDIATWGDGIANALLAAVILCERRESNPGLTSAELLDFFTPMAQLHTKIVVGDKNKALDNPAIQEAIRSEIENLGGTSRIVIRPSGTEDVVRIMVETLDHSRAQQTLATFVDIVKKECE